MTVFGLPTETALAFGLTVLVGCTAGIHYVVVHKLLGVPIGEAD